MKSVSGRKYECPDNARTISDVLVDFVLTRSRAPEPASTRARFAPTVLVVSYNPLVPGCGGLKASSAALGDVDADSIARGPE